MVSSPPCTFFALPAVHSQLPRTPTAALSESREAHAPRRSPLARPYHRRDCSKVVLERHPVISRARVKRAGRTACVTTSDLGPSGRLASIVVTAMRIERIKRLLVGPPRIPKRAQDFQS